MNAVTEATTEPVRLAGEQLERRLEDLLHQERTMASPTPSTVPHMIERGSGRIVNISSIIGEIGSIGQANYAAIPLRRLGRPEEIGRVAHFLCADASSYITGQVWNISGGMDR